MRIGIDARMLGPTVGGGGLGRYVEELVLRLIERDHTHHYVLFLKTNGQIKKITPQKNVETTQTDIHWYTLKEQLFLGRRIDKEQLDLIHFPHWNVPLFLKTPFIVTIHDLILLEQPRSAKATTRHPLIYALKRLGYKIVLRHALKKSRKIIAVSQYTKNAILSHFPWVPPEKIQVVYEGLTSLPQTPCKNIELPTPYILYVGNAYPHKNLEALLQAFKQLHQRNNNVHLVLAGRNDIFYQRLKNMSEDMNLDTRAITFILNPTDAKIACLYQHASLYAFPSLSEGFGLPPLEAMSFNVPVAAARASCLPEILGDAAIWFDPKDPKDIAHAIEKGLSDKSFTTDLVAKGSKQITRYSWKTMAKEIQDIYTSCA